MATTQTIGPLHVEDLEPHRFEDLVRQLIYDFRNWRMLETTGRSGSDEGFDVRGTEVARREERGRWNVLTYKGSFSDGLHFVCDRHFAYLGEDGEEWDYAECINDGPIHSAENPWREKDDYEDSEDRSAAMGICDAFPEGTKAWYEICAVLPFENILDVDENVA